MSCISIGMRATLWAQLLPRTSAVKPAPSPPLLAARRRGARPGWHPARRPPPRWWSSWSRSRVAMCRPDNAWVLHLGPDGRYHRSGKGGTKQRSQ